MITIFTANERDKEIDIYRCPVIILLLQGEVFVTLCDFICIGYTLYSMITIVYSRLSLSGLRLSRTTAYLKVKIWSLLEHENLTRSNKIL